MKRLWNFIKRIFIRDKIIYPHRNNSSQWHEVELRILHFVNTERLIAGLPAVEPDKTLRLFAEGRAIHYKVLGRLDNHVGLNKIVGTLNDLGLRAVGENLYRGSIESYASEIVRAWMNSPGHKKVILNKNMRYCGVGFAHDNKRKYICLLVAR